MRIDFLSSGQPIRLMLLMRALINKKSRWILIVFISFSSIVSLQLALNMGVWLISACPLKLNPYCWMMHSKLFSTCKINGVPGGGLPMRRISSPPFADTPEWRIRLRDVNKGGVTYWQAGVKYQILLGLNLFDDKRHPDQERYLITLGVGSPWLPEHIE